MYWDLFNEDDVSGYAKDMLLKLYFYMSPILMHCQECGIRDDSKEIVDFLEYMNKYYKEEIENELRTRITD